MTLQEMQQLISDTDAKIATQAGPQTEAKAITGIEITAAIAIGITVLSAVKALLWWKPSWQTAIGNVITFLQTFETILPSSLLLARPLKCRCSRIPSSLLSLP